MSPRAILSSGLTAFRVPRRVICASSKRWTALVWHGHRAFSSGIPCLEEHPRDSGKQSILDTFNSSIQFPPSTHGVQDLAAKSASVYESPVVLHGYLSTQRVANAKLTFVELLSLDGTHTVQVVINASSAQVIKEQLKAIRPYAPIAVTGRVVDRKAPNVSQQPSESLGVKKITNVEVVASDLAPLNDFPADIVVASGTVIPAEQRHLQLRTSHAVREAIIFRSRACETIRKFLYGDRQFLEIETPLLFKSTPEGAHEFLVPTRTPGQAYALPQSPQQYKQILMASGIPRYMQIAKCFRDEDLRADRQPEFTQVDLEMAFAGEDQVMEVVESLIKKMWLDLLQLDFTATAFPRMSYDDAMSRYGSDKPDTRLGAEISRIDYMIPVDLTGKITGLQEPIVEVMKFSISSNPRDTQRFVASFMDAPESRPFMENPNGQPGIFIYEPSRPLSGLQPFGFEAAEALEEKLELEQGDLVVIQARPNEPFSGGSTVIGNLRLALHKYAVSQGLLERPTGWNFLWVTDFPLFTKADEADTPSSDITPPETLHSDEPGIQTPSAGTVDDASPIQPRLESTHHPFTAPLPSSAHLLFSDPLSVKAAHYDLVLNGVELGGGSRRIHHAAMQRLVLKDLLQLSDERMHDFDHLLEVLRAGCPPHAGMALGLDRLIMLMLGKESVRDVIAFPKGGGGVDALIKAPSEISEEHWKRYYLQTVGKVG